MWLWNLTENKGVEKKEEDVKDNLLEPSKKPNKEYNARLDEIADHVTRLEEVISVCKQDEEVVKIQKWKLFGCCIDKVFF